jgi:hypothetical protein
MPLNEGEQQALLTQVTQQINATEVKIRRLGLPHVKVGLFDDRTRRPISDLQEIIDMAEGREPKTFFQGQIEELIDRTEVRDPKELPDGQQAES